MAERGGVSEFFFFLVCHVYIAFFPAKYSAFSTSYQSLLRSPTLSTLPRLSFLFPRLPISKSNIPGRPAQKTYPRSSYHLIKTETSRSSDRVNHTTDETKKVSKQTRKQST